MLKEIIINSTSTQTRVAITEDGNLVDFFVDYPENRRMVGDIYLGRIARVLPGIRAAFIDIGMKHDAFLHFSDIGERTQQLQDMLGDEDSEVDDEDENNHSGSTSETTQTTIPTLKKGQDILIQIIKEPVNNKGVRVTSSISLPGRFCVLLPYDNKVGVSKKLTDYRERKRLRYIARQIIPQNCGLIIRTVAQGQPEDALKDDLTQLLKKWKEIEKRAKSTSPPELVYQDLNTTVSVVRDLFNSDVSKIFVDSKKLYKEIKNYLGLVQPDMAEKVEPYKSSHSIFDSFKIDEQIKTLMGRKVPLPSGGYLIIEHTEAMIVIDVNSGRYAKSKEQELNSLKTDLEAAREIVRQTRLRDIGGIIVVDFIDLEDDKNRKKVYDELRKEFRKDRAKVSILPMSDFGLIQITRQRIRQNIVQALKETCPVCHGTGLLTKSSHVVYDLETLLRKLKMRTGERNLIIKCHPSTAAKLREGKIKSLMKLQLKFFIRIKLQEDEGVAPDSFVFISGKSGDDLTKEIE
ncbi:MAG: Rne/Rng family ribonuclease [Ignavibacteria bacterium]|nr:Rne/Rng family ribonuclease [Ignavibacteria bacterium]MBT8381725.1 Rne/Rng family ribonuclease [Ignavibacteria bacterium]MBT8391096.1 Rne/Rng family ribonuclease [Ignavibacteria bacterium]NNJ53689.1 Rne/Rng family ribonuclease [Ignavibacteriaceae bacterium]NNL21591.1 Rne/Rng family ribonuclease [Ignavibacteriaceae bacterium]